MKKQLSDLLTGINNKTVNGLTSEVKEVLTAGYIKTKGSILSIADLWNIQRRGRIRPQRHYF